MFPLVSSAVALRGVTSAQEHPFPGRWDQADCEFHGTEDSRLESA